jgi:hypothetical protein
LYTLKGNFLWFGIPGLEENHDIIALCLLFPSSTEESHPLCQVKVPNPNIAKEGDTVSLIPPLHQMGNTSSKIPLARAEPN